MKKIIILGAAVCTLSLPAKAQDPILPPVEASEIWKTDMIEGNLTGLWDGMPASYQEDLQDLLELFAASADEEIYNEAIKTAKLFNGFTAKRKDLLLQIMENKMGERKPKKVAYMKAHWDMMNANTAAFLETDVKDLESLKTATLREMAVEMQPQMQKAMKAWGEADACGKMKDFKNAQFELLSEEGDKASVILKVPNKPEKTIALELVDGVWVPECTVAKWDKGIEKMKAGLKRMGDIDEQQKDLIVQILKLTQDSIVKLEGAETEEEMIAIMMKQSEAFAPLMMPLFLQMKMQK